MRYEPWAWRCGENKTRHRPAGSAREAATTTLGNRGRPRRVQQHTHSRHMPLRLAASLRSYGPCAAPRMDRPLRGSLRARSHRVEAMQTWSFPLTTHRRITLERAVCSPLRPTQPTPSSSRMQCLVGAVAWAKTRIHQPAQEAWSALREPFSLICTAFQLVHIQIRD